MNLANKITVFRVVLIPVIMVFLLLDIPHGSLIAAGIFALASVSDWLDGQIARKFNMVTNFGKIMDPLADKLLVFAAILCLLEKGAFPAWCAMIILTREFLVMGLRVVAVGDGKVIAASMWGKVKTTIQLVAMILAMVFQNTDWAVISQIAIYTTTVFTAISGVAYIVENKDVF